MGHKDVYVCACLSDHPFLCSFLPVTQGFMGNSREEVVAGEGDLRYSVPAFRAALEPEGTIFPRL